MVRQKDHAFSLPSRDYMAMGIGAHMGAELLYLNYIVTSGGSSLLHGGGMLEQGNVALIMF